MGWFFVLLQGNDIEELKKEKERRLEEIKAIDEKIAELERKN
jgi:hypothetical protein